MDFLDLMSLKKAASKLTLATDVMEFMPFLNQVGVGDVAMAEQVLKAARVASRDPGETVMDFISNGGLIRLLAGKSADDVPTEMITQCNHCGELNVLSYE